MKIQKTEWRFVWLESLSTPVVPIITSMYSSTRCGCWTKAIQELTPKDLDRDTARRNLRRNSGRVLRATITVEIPDKE